MQSDHHGCTCGQCDTWVSDGLARGHYPAGDNADDFNKWEQQFRPKWGINWPVFWGGMLIGVGSAAVWVALIIGYLYWTGK